jgi:hypothetical protein
MDVGSIHAAMGFRGALMDDATYTASDAAAIDVPFVGKLWERVHDGEVTVSATEISPGRFRVAAFFPNGQEWAPCVASSDPEAKDIGDALVRRVAGHVCTDSCREWALTQEPAGWSDAQTVQPPESTGQTASAEGSQP